MANQIYSSSGYVIFQVSKSGYVVANKKKKFSEGHTHINSIKTAKYLISLAAAKRVPNHLSDYLLVSLIRITDIPEYADKVQSLLECKMARRQQYYQAAACAR